MVIIEQHKAILKPNTYPIRELKRDAQDVHKGVEFRIEGYFTSPLPGRLLQSVR
jgi:hypothetical protein